MNIMRNAFKRANYVLCLLLALSGTSCINRLNDEIKEGSILISFSFEASKAATKVTKNTFDIGDRSGIFAMLTGNSLDQQRYIDNLLLECSDNSKLISKKEVYYPEGDATLDFISYYPYQEENSVQRKLTAGRHSTSRPEQDRQLQLIQLHDRPHRKRAQQRKNRKAGIQAPVCQNKVSSYTPRR